MADLTNKSYRFPPTRRLRASYSSIVPEASREGEKARALESVLQQREETDKAAEEISYPIRIPAVSYPLETECGNESGLPWPARLQGPLFHKIAVLRRALYLAAKDVKEMEESTCTLVESAHESPSATAKLLSRHMSSDQKLVEAVRSEAVQCAEDRCRKNALPFSRHCLAHISRDVDQVLYTSCTATDSTHLSCGEPVYDFMLNQPLCLKHVTKAAIECPVQQKKKPVSSKGRGQRVRKTKTRLTVKVAPPQVVLPKSHTSTSTSSSVLPLPTASSSSWSSGDSEGEEPVIIPVKRKKVIQQASVKEHRLPLLTPDALSLPLPLPILPPPLPDIGKLMDDSSSDEGH